MQNLNDWYEEYETPAPTMNIVAFAGEILDLHSENKRLRKENAMLMEYKQKYLDQIDADIKHGQEMMANTIRLLISPHVEFKIKKEE